MVTNYPTTPRLALISMNVLAIKKSVHTSVTTSKVLTRANVPMVSPCVQTAILVPLVVSLLS